MKNIKEDIKKITTKYQSMLEKTTHTFHMLGYIKLFMIASLLLELCLLWKYALYRTGICIVATATLMALAAIWRHHISIHHKKDRYETILRIAAQQMERATGQWRSFTDTGREFADAEHPYCDDLDIVGPYSLYQMLNVARTEHGRRQFAADLLRSSYGGDEIAERQQAVAELEMDMEHAVLFQSDTINTQGKTAILPVLEDLQDSGIIIPPPVRYLLYWLPPAITLFFAAAALFGNATLRLAATFLCAAQGIFWVVGLSRTKRLLAGANAAPRVFAYYSAAMERVTAREYTSPRLAGIRQGLGEGTDSAITAMKKLDAIMGMVNIKHQGIFYLAANLFLLWDYRCVIALEDWKSRYGGRCAIWFELLGEYESLLSLSMLHTACDHTISPVIEAKPGILFASQIGHPLLANEIRVDNDIGMDGGLIILSGSNMSGKTTFLRTVGINLVLARAGGRVCASTLHCSLFYIRSSMRITDNLDLGISSFYAELRKIAAIIEDARGRDNLFFLIDELFRGTNSEDRLFGARAVIEELAALPTMGMITTHDLSLCALAEEHTNIRNFSFSEQYEGQCMLFDYLMRPGKAQTTNARFLMQQVGIL